MIEIEVPKDITKYEAKLVASFTTRQVGCLAIAGVLAVPTFLAIRDVVPRDAATLIVLILVLPFILLGWVKPYGMNFEQFVRTAFISNVLSPKKRKYVTMNVYDFIENENFEEDSIKQRKLMTKKEMRKEMNTKISSKIKYYT